MKVDKKSGASHEGMFRVLGYICTIEGFYYYTKYDVCTASFWIACKSGDDLCSSLEYGPYENMTDAVNDLKSLQKK